MFQTYTHAWPGALLAAACSIDRPHPTDATVASTATVAFSAVKFWEAGATVSWNQFATDLAQAAPAPGVNTIRLYTYSRSLSSVLPRRHRPPRARIHRSPRPLWRFGRRAELILPGSVTSPKPRSTPGGFRPVARRQARGFRRGRGDRSGGRSARAHVRAERPRWAHESTGSAIGPPPVGPGNWIYAPPPLLARGNLSARSFFLTSARIMKRASTHAVRSDSQ